MSEKWKGSNKDLKEGQKNLKISAKDDDNRVVGGETTGVNEYPWMALVVKQGITWKVPQRTMYKSWWSLTTENVKIPAFNTNTVSSTTRYVKSYANKDSCAAMLHCCFAASEMAFSESSQPPLLHCIATSLQSHIKWQSELKQYNSRCFVALLQYYIRCQSELKADPATSLLCYNLCQPEHNTSLAASLLRCNLI